MKHKGCGGEYQHIKEKETKSKYYAEHYTCRKCGWVVFPEGAGKEVN